MAKMFGISFLGSLSLFDVPPKNDCLVIDWPTRRRRVGANRSDGNSRRNKQTSPAATCKSDSVHPHTHTHTHTHTQREKPMAVKRKTDRSRFAASEATLGGTRVALLCCVCVELLAVFVWNRFGTRSATWKATHGRAVLFFGFCRRSLFGPRRPMGRHLVDPLIGC